MRKLFSMNSLFKRIKTILFPLSPAVLTFLLEHILNNKYEITEVSNIILRDPGLSSQVLKVANSPFYGKERVSTMKHALVYLTFRTIKHIIISSTVICMLSRYEKLEEIGFDLGRFWSHCIRIAVISRSLACEMNYQLPDEVFIAGLLHDIGQLVLVQSFPDEYKRAIDKIKAGKPTINAEEEVFGTNSAEVGAWVMQQWRLPSPLPDVAKEQRCHLDEMQNLSSKIVHIAHLLATSYTLPPENREFYLKGIIKEIDPIVSLSLNDIERILVTSAAEEVIVANALGIYIKGPQDWEIGPIFQNQLKILEKLFIFQNIWSDLKEDLSVMAILRHAWETLSFTFGTEKIIFLLFDKWQKVLESKMEFEGVSIPIDREEDIIVQGFLQKRILHSKELKDKGFKLNSKVGEFFEDREFFILPLYGKEEIGVILIEDVFLEQYEDWKRLLLWIAEAVASKLKIAILSLKNEEILKEKERIEKELRAAIEKLVEVEKRIAAIETAGTIAHTLNQSIMVIQGRAELLMKRIEKDSKEYKDLEKIINECSKMDSFIQKLLTITHYKRKPYNNKSYIIDVENPVYGKG